MNQVFKPLLRKCVLIFFDDILVYSSTLDEHSNHLHQVFILMQTKQMCAKPSKCAFAIHRIECLGHYISSKGLETDLRRIDAVAQWPVPTSVKELTSFLGLSGYYRKFIRGYAHISKPLTDLLKKGAFEWSDTASTAFNSLKQALVSAPVPNFSIPFEVETDASKRAIGAVLMQVHHPIAYISRSLGPRWQALSVYEKKPAENLNSLSTILVV